jgi:hypothetical protein
VFHDVSIEEMRDADGLISRILMCDGHPNLQKLNAIQVGENTQEMLRLALDSEKAAVAQFNASAQECHDLGDHGSASVFEEMVRDEEKHADWFEGQIDAVERGRYRAVPRPADRRGRRAGLNHEFSIASTRRGPANSPRPRPLVDPEGRPNASDAEPATSQPKCPIAGGLSPTQNQKPGPPDVVPAGHNVPGASSRRAPSLCPGMMSMSVWTTAGNALGQVPSADTVSGTPAVGPEGRRSSANLDGTSPRMPRPQYSPGHGRGNLLVVATLGFFWTFVQWFEGYRRRPVFRV